MIVPQTMLAATARALFRDTIRLRDVNGLTLWEGPGMAQTDQERLVNLDQYLGIEWYHQTMSLFLPMDAPAEEWVDAVILASANPRIIDRPMTRVAAPLDTWGIYQRFWVELPPQAAARVNVT